MSSRPTCAGAHTWRRGKGSTQAQRRGPQTGTERRQLREHARLAPHRQAIRNASANALDTIVGTLVKSLIPLTPKSQFSRQERQGTPSDNVEPPAVNPPWRRLRLQGLYVYFLEFLLVLCGVEYIVQIFVDNALTECTLCTWLMCTLSRGMFGNAGGVSGPGYRGIGTGYLGSARTGSVAFGWF